MKRIPSRDWFPKVRLCLKLSSNVAMDGKMSARVLPSFAPRTNMNLVLPSRYVILMDVSTELTDAHFIYKVFARICDHVQYSCLKILTYAALLQYPWLLWTAVAFGRLWAVTLPGLAPARVRLMVACAGFTNENDWDGTSAGEDSKKSELSCVVDGNIQWCGQCGKQLMAGPQRN